VKAALLARHLADDKELKQSLLQSRGREFYDIGIKCLTRCWQKCFENDKDILEK
jgi:hypothetical protein